MDTLQATYDNMSKDCKKRIRELIEYLESIDKKIDRGFVLNELGELQGVACILDCRLASMATVQSLMMKYHNGKMT